MKALVGAFNQEKALVGAFSVIVQLVVEPIEHYTALVRTVGLSKLSFTASKLQADSISGPARLRLVKWSNINTKLNLLIFVIDLDTS